MAGQGVVPASEHFVGALAEKENAVTCGITDLFAPCTMDDVLQSGTLAGIQPLNFSEDADYYEFQIRQRGDQYLLPTATRMYVETRIVNKDGSSPSRQQALSVAPINNLGPSLFNTIVPVIKGSNESLLIDSCAHYKAYVSNLLSYGTGESSMYTHVCPDVISLSF